MCDLIGECSHPPTSRRSVFNGQILHLIQNSPRIGTVNRIVKYTDIVRGVDFPLSSRSVLFGEEIELATTLMAEFPFVPSGKNGLEDPPLKVHVSIN